MSELPFVMAMELVKKLFEFDKIAVDERPEGVAFICELDVIVPNTPKRSLKKWLDQTP